MISEHGAFALEYIRAHKALGSLTIAKILCRERPDMYTDVEGTRCMIRYYRGAQGEARRKDLKPENYVPFMDIPEGDGKDLEPLDLPPDAFPLAIASDIHFPYHSREALELFLETAYAAGAKTILLNGDTFDCYLLSSFDKDPKARSFADELALGCEVINGIAAKFPAVMLKLGNHEHRLERYVMANAPELYGLDDLTMSAQINKRLDKPIVIIPQNQIIKALGLHIIHGHEYRFAIASPVNPARGLFLKAKKSALCGHHHRTSEHSETAIDGSAMTCWSTGCLCDLHPEYNRLNSWNHGFAIVYNDDGYYTVANKKVIKWRVL